VEARRLDGRELARRIRVELAAEVERYREEHGVAPCLVVLLVGDDPASAVYVERKSAACREVGIEARTERLPATTTAEELRRRVEELNADPGVNGVLVQLPLPGDIAPREVFEWIDPRKDVDGFHPLNVGRLQLGDLDCAPCTPAGVLALLDDAGIPLAGCEAVVVGRSAIVGRPMASLLTSRHSTVTLCHSRTRDLEAVCRRADLLVAAVGRPWILDERHIKPGAVVVDVGITRVDAASAPAAVHEAGGRWRRKLERNGRVLLGDVRADHALARASWYTPVPGGVGPMTVAMLLRRTLQLARAQQEEVEHGS
jgi:methylenetetrahydrofolate dehydrogenase (NADP+)/methenyltetrahydrofolate cyclohydrolase